MALTPKEQKQLNDLIEEGVKLARQLGDEVSRIKFEELKNSSKQTTDNLRDAETSVKGLRSEWADLTTDVSQAATSFKNIVSDIKQTNTGVGETTRGFNKLASIASKVSQIQQGTLDVDQKGLKSLTSQIDAQIKQFKVTKGVLENEKKRLLGGRAVEQLSAKERKQYEQIKASLTEINGELGDSTQQHKAIKDAITTEEQKLNAVNKAMGLSGALAKTVADKLGVGADFGEALANTQKDLKDKLKVVNEETGEVSHRQATFNEKLGAAGKLAGGLGKSLMGAALDPVTLFTKLFSMVKGADKAAGDFAKSMNVTYTEAVAAQQEMATIANNSGDAAINSERLMKSTVTIGKALGSNAKVNEADLKTFTKLTEQAGLSSEAALGLQKLSFATGKSLEDNTAEFLAQAKITAQNNGVVLNEKQLLEEVANVSADIKASTGLTGKGLAEAAAQAKSLGMSLDQVNKIADSLLDFESSIQSELEAELLTGKQLNLEKARQAALDNDLATLSKELANNYGDLSDFQNMNRIQQEAIAKSVGMSREELAKSLLEAEALAGLSGEQAENAKKAFDARVEAVGLEQAQREMEKGGIENLMDQQSQSDRLNQSMSKLGDIFNESIVPALLLVGEIFTTIIESATYLLTPITAMMGFFKGIGDAIGQILLKLGPVGKALKAIAGVAIIYAAYKAYASLATLPVVGVPLGIAAAAAVTSLGFGLLNAQKVQDGIAPAEKGPFTVTDKFGATAITTEGDSIAVSPNVKKGEGKKAAAAEGGGGGKASVDMGPVVAAINELIATVKAGGTIEIDGQAVGRAITLVDYQTGGG